MEIKMDKVVLDGSRGILALGEDNKMYIWNYQDATWDLLKHEHGCTK
jgi:hypothetical protein